MRTEKVVSVNENFSPSIGSAVIAVLISMLLGIGFTFMFGTAFELEFEFFPAFILLFIASLGFSIIHYMNRMKLSAGALIAAPALFAVMMIFDWFGLQKGLLAFLYYVKLYAFYRFPGFYAAPEEKSATVFAFIIAYNMVVSCFTVFVLLRRKWIPAALLGYLPLFICSVANIVMRPSQIPCLVTASGIFMLLLTHALRYKKHQTAELSLLILTIPVLSLTLLTGVVFPEKKYTCDKLAKDILVSIQETVDKSSSKDNPVSKMLDTAINGFRNPNAESRPNFFSPLYSTTTDLSHVGPFDPPQDRIMTVYRKNNPDYQGDAEPYRGNIMYLKVESLDKYEDNTLSSTRVKMKIYADGYEPAYENGQYEVLITPLTDAGVDISPYYSDFYLTAGSENPSVNPYNYTRNNVYTYASSNVPVKTGNIYSDWYLDQYVYKTALTVPKATENALTMSGKLPDWYMEVFLGHIEMSDAEKVRRVTEFVRGLHPYDENTELPPEDVDFVPWFVSEAESGICVHYAITSVILLRMIGVPARYVRGYVDTRSYNNAESVIFASQAHAWFEFFVPEYGWIMGDATPGYGIDAENFNIDAVAKVSPEINEAAFSREHYKTAKENGAYETTRPTETIEMTTSETDSTDTSGSTPTPTVASGDPSSNMTVPSNTSYFDGGNHPDNDDNEPEPVIKLSEKDIFRIKVFAGILIAVIAVFLLLMLFKLAFTIYWMDRFRTEKINDKAVSYYHYYRFMGRIFRFELPSKATEIAEKATFSGCDITPKELNMLLTACKEHMKACSTSFSRIKSYLYKLFEINIQDHK